MNKKQVIAFLKEAKQSPPLGAMEQCISTLPEVRTPNRILPLVKLQINALPASVYILALVAILFQIILAISLRPIDALMSTSISSAIVVLLFGWHLMISSAGSMIEIEKCCKYSYGQILLARSLCLCGLSLISLMIASIPCAKITHMGITYILAATLPTIVGALTALIWVNHVGNSDFAQLTIYLVAALITGLILERIVEAGIYLLCTILLTTIVILFIQTITLTNRRINYEAYNY